MTIPSTLYVYYKVPALERTATRNALDQYREKITKDIPRLELALMKRPELKDGVETWMEIYTHPDGITDTIVAAINDCLNLFPKLSRWPRATERFVSLD